MNTHDKWKNIIVKPKIKIKKHTKNGDDRPDPPCNNNGFGAEKSSMIGKYRKQKGKELPKISDETAK
ncbi:hypothetical protein HNP82_001989 [Catenibacillus scindens]|uniref:Uncharacterized protein n=1 Tax=Catenibacillus scindens TaxID=673271 RepID=A0A7W8M5A1_9FIRM|nr:hypothetical protein [Catenibacillus scindens]MBB5264850.1 hypothetical protein [Catenibacillus scindens]